LLAGSLEPFQALRHRPGKDDRQLRSPSCGRRHERGHVVERTPLVRTRRLARPDEDGVNRWIEER